MTPKAPKLTLLSSLGALAFVLSALGGCSLVEGDFTGEHRDRDASVDSAPDTSVRDAGNFDAPPDFSDSESSADRDEGGDRTDGEEGGDGPDGDEGGDGDAGPLVPPDVPGIVLWLDAGRGIEFISGVNGQVSKWSDQSALHNDAVQTNPQFSPLWAPNVLNGLPAVRFPGPTTFLSIPDSASLRWGIADFSIIVVVQRQTKVLGGLIYQKVFTTPPYTGPAFVLTDQELEPVVQVNSNVWSAGTSLQVQKPYLLTGRRVGPSMQMRVNGLTQRWKTGPEGAADEVDCSSQLPSQIGHNGYNTSPWNESLGGDIAEMILVSGPITDGDLHALEDYLMAKYHLDPLS